MPTERKAGLAVTRALALAAACVALVSCGKPKLDTSTPQTTDASLARMRKALTVQQQEKLNEALVLLSIGRGIHAGGPAGLPPFVSKNPDPLSQGSLKPLHGKTAEDIIAEADHVLAERREKERAQALIEIKDLEAAKEAAENARLELARFEVVKSRFSQRPDLLGNRPLIELTVKNGTPHPVSRAFFRGTLASPDPVAQGRLRIPDPRRAGARGVGHLVGRAESIQRVGESRRIQGRHPDGRGHEARRGGRRDPVQCGLPG
jgi:uncharacterized protein DUF6694